MPRIKIEAPAKLNLHLKVGDRRPDGFHDIESLFLALAFGDTLYLETTPSETMIPPDIRMDWQFGGLSPAIPPEKNIISRVVSLFRSRTSFNAGLKVTVEKRIPLGSGLGGGSSDAAAVLLALNRLASDGTALISEVDLVEMGASLGSDVPFFLHRAFARASAAWVSGRGETIRPLELPESAQNLAFVLVNPGFSSDTAEAYRLLDEFRTERPHTEEGPLCPPQQTAPRSGVDRPLQHVVGSIYSAVCDQKWACPGKPNSRPCLGELHSFPFTNDFLPVLTSSDNGTIYRRIIADLRELGADFAGLSGSGSTCFGVFSEQKRAESVRRALLEHWPFVINTFLLAH